MCWGEQDRRDKSDYLVWMRLHVALILLYHLVLFVQEDPECTPS